MSATRPLSDATPSTHVPNDFPGVAATDQATHPVSLVIDGEQHTIAVAPGQTILEAALAQGVDVPHFCRKGRCGTCTGQCTRGTARMRDDDAFAPCLPEQSIAEGGVLACSTYVDSDDVMIVIDADTRARLLPRGTVSDGQRKDTPEREADELNAESRFDLRASVLYGWFTISIMFPAVIELIILPLFSAVLTVDAMPLRATLGGGIVLIAFVLAPLMHFTEALVFRLPARFHILGRVPLGATVRAPLSYFPAAIVIWMIIEAGIHYSSGVYRTPTIGEMLLYMTVLQVSNIFIMDLVFWLVHGPKGLHHPAVYQHLHAKHHRQRVSTFSTGPDLSPVDMVAEVSIFTGVPLLCGFALGLDSLAFVCCSLVNTLMTSTWAHSPYKTTKVVPQASVVQYLLYLFPFLIANPHSSHHAKIECNYSIWGFWDKVFGTYREVTAEDERTARAVQIEELSRPATTSFFFPRRSALPYAEWVGTALFCALLWFLAARAGIRPTMLIEQALLPAFLAG